MSDKHYKNILWGGVALLLIFAPLCRGAVRLWSITPVLLTIYFLVFLWLFRLTGPAKVLRPPKTAPLDRLIFLFVILAVISSIFSVYKHESFYDLLRLLGYVGFYYLVLNNFNNKMRNRLLGLIVVSGTAVSLYGLLQYFGVFSRPWWFPPEFLAATYVNHNHFAGYLELVIPVAFGMLAGCSSERFYFRLLLAAAFSVLLAAFVLAESRAGGLSLAVSLLVMSVFLFKKTGSGKKNVFVFIVIGMLVFAFSGEKIEKEPSFTRRLEMWQASVKMIQDRPLKGAGLGAFDAAFYKHRPQGFNERAIYAHNEYLHMAAEMGVLAPLLMIGLLFIVLKTGFARSSDFGILGCSAGVLSLALHCLADFNFHIPANMLLLTVYAAFIMSTAKKEKG